MHPVFLQLGPLEIRYYGLMYVISFVLGYFLIRADARRRGLPIGAEQVLDLLILTIPLALIGARVYYVAFEWDAYRGAPLEILKLWRGGLAIHGGILGGALGLWIFSRRKSLAFWLLTDIAVPALALGQALGRLGNFLNGDAFGTPTNLPWGLVFPRGTPAGDTYPGQPLHPAMLYEMAGMLILFGLLLRLRKRKHSPGFLTAVYGIGYGLIRFPIEYVRGDALMLGPLRAAQLASVLLIVGFGVWLSARRLWRHPGTSPRQAS